VTAVEKLNTGQPAGDYRVGAKAVRCFTSSARVGPNRTNAESAYTTLRTGSHGSTVYQPITDQGRTGRENSSLDSTRLPCAEAVRLDSRGDFPSPLGYVPVTLSALSAWRGGRVRETDGAERLVITVNVNCIDAHLSTEQLSAATKRVRF
jgi:hypothetical protein